MSPASKAAARKAPRKRAKKQVQIRMYNVGFGDCFLLRIPTADGERRMLVDCGYHSQGKGKFTDAELVKQIKKDLAGEQLDVVVATHRHQDHISGFGETALWRDIPVEEVWLPFTANPAAAATEPALRAWHGLMEAAHRLVGVDGTLLPDAANRLSAREQDDRDEAAFLLWNARANAPGIENLLSGMKRKNRAPAKRRFLPDALDTYPTQFTTDALPGVVTHVLGPPSDPALRKSKKVPSTWGFKDGSLVQPGSDPDAPFSDDWQVPADQVPPRRPFRDRTLNAIRLFNDDLLYAARALDGFLNGESLVLVLEIGTVRLLLPGDAEVGTWTMILDNEDALEITASATFLKVGHHGSHNATPLVLIDEYLASDTHAMISTQEGPGKYRNGIPLQRLIATLTARGIPFARSDKAQGGGASIFHRPTHRKWVDCTILC